MDTEEKLASLAGAIAQLEARRSQIVRVPVVSAAEVEAMERSLSIELPAEYRAFVTRIARGLSDPEIWSFDEVRWGGAEIQPWSQPDLSLGEPFAFDEIEWPDDEAAAEEMEDGLMDAPLRGIVPIAYWGCQYYDLLVVNGPARGQVWCSELPYAFRPFELDTGPATFLEYAMFRVMNALHGRDTFRLLYAWA
jgi:hypothetical protein